jgi:murein DD-endopeptidase MepM/ murein hydrolase activator NlpD
VRRLHGKPLCAPAGQAAGRRFREHREVPTLPGVVSSATRSPFHRRMSMAAVPLPRRIRTWAGGAVLFLGAVGAGVASLAAAPRTPADEPPPLHRLPPVQALPLRMDTLFLGGYARGSFFEALQTIAGDLSGAERTLIGRHLDKIFVGVLGGADLERGGRLRLAYERALRSDGTTRSVRVLAAEAAVGGQMHTALFFEHDDQPGFYDPLGRSLDARAWVRPLPHTRVTSPFNAQRMHPILERVLPHLGVDYAAAAGTPVRAAGDGSISAAGWRGGYGNLVEIQHPNGYTTRYGHLSGFAPGAHAGAFVRQGEVIGYVGATGLATGPHLHYEVRRRGRPIDPEVALAEANLTTELPFSPEWSAERQRLSQLLSRAPRALSRPLAAGP